MISLEKFRKILTPLPKLYENIDFGKIRVAKGFEKLPKSNKLPNLVTLPLLDKGKLSCTK